MILTLLDNKNFDSKLFTRHSKKHSAPKLHQWFRYWIIRKNRNEAMMDILKEEDDDVGTATLI